ncbi:MAG: DUF6377 domain-containing protein [Reichenbachiella sp.]
MRFGKINVGLLLLLMTMNSHALVAQSDIYILDSVLNSKENHLTVKLAKIEKLNKRLKANEGASLESQFKITNSLYHEYKSFVFDSAFQYGNRLLGLSLLMEDSVLEGYSKTNLGFTLLSAGMFTEANETLNSVSVNTLHDSTKIAYYALMVRMYYDLMEHNRDSYYTPRYGKNADTYVDFVLNMADPKSYHYIYLSGLRDLRENRTDQAVETLNKLMVPGYTDSHQFAITASTLSYLHLKLGDTARAVTLLVDASVSDIQNGVKETSALTSLAQLLYHTGDIESAYKYINISMEDAQYYGAIQRMSQVGHILPIISSSKLLNVEGQRKKLIAYSIGLTLLTISTFLFAILMIRQRKKVSKKDVIIKRNNDILRTTNEELSETNIIKDEYLGFFFSLNSKYLEQMAAAKKSIESKLLENKHDDIRYLLKKMNLKKEKADLFTHFDESFVKIFPSFIFQFNELFEEPNKFIPVKGEILNTELRLFALIRIGIKDSDRLASILGYSVNTIYAYKNRIKNQSLISNNEFEKNVMDIQSK